MNKPILLIMAAGMGSRYGGLKQMDEISEQGEIIMDFSMYDAMMAGFEKVVFVIKEEMKAEFEKFIREGVGKKLETEFVYQKLSDLPDGYGIPEGRIKPWGTAHAIYSARKVIDGPFAVINADDYYGPAAFLNIYEELEKCDDESLIFFMVSYALRNTITENGTVSRGVITVDKNGFLEDIVERTKIKRVEGGIGYTEDDGNSWTMLDENTQVSMNFWGYTSRIMKALEDQFPEFLDKTLVENPLKGEYPIPTVTDNLIKREGARVKVLNSGDRWYGVTYKEDKQNVVAALQSLKDRGLYPEKLWQVVK